MTRKTISACGQVIEQIRAGEMVKVHNQDRRHHRENPTYWALRVDVGPYKGVPLLLTNFQLRRALRRAAKAENYADVPQTQRVPLTIRAVKALSVLFG